jgi:hypothetical protein
MCQFGSSSERQWAEESLEMVIGGGLLFRISKSDDADPDDESAMATGWRSSDGGRSFSPGDAVEVTRTSQSRELLIFSPGDAVEATSTPKLPELLVFYVGNEVPFFEVSVTSKLRELLK